MKLLQQSAQHYVLDSNFFMSARDHYFQDTFPSFWKKMSFAYERGVISSVREVRKEIVGYESSPENPKKQQKLKTRQKQENQERISGWINQNKGIFELPSEEEQNKVTEIMTRFPNAARKQGYQGKPWADIFIIARAWNMNAIVVTEEISKKDNQGNVNNPHKIPDICTALEVGCITPQEFMKEQGWSF